jgi:hypothetical protein
MSFIGTSSTFSARGFGGLGNNSVIIPFSGTAIGYGTTGNKIFNIAIDSSNNLIGSYGDDIHAGGAYLFKYTPNAKRIYWVDNARSSFVAGTSDGYAISIGQYNSILLPPTGTAGIRGNTNSSYWNITFTGVQFLHYVTVDGTNVYGARIVPADGLSVTQGGAIIFKVTSTGTYVSTNTVYYSVSYNPGTGITTYSGSGITSMNGKYVTLYGQYGNSIGTGTSDYTSGYHNTITSGTIVKYVSKNAYCYIAYTNNGSVGIARLDSSGNLSNNHTYTDGHTMNITGFDVDVTNGYMLLSYNNGIEDRITRFDLSGNVQWTRKLTKTSGLLGITQLLCSNDDSYYYLTSNNNIFEFLTNGDILAPGSYTSNGVTYTYGTTTAWVNSTSNLFALDGTRHTWSSNSVTSAYTATSGSPTSSTPLLTWNTF